MARTLPVIVDAVSGSGTTLASNSITPVSGVLYLVAVANYHASVGTPTLTGTNGLNVTWTQVTTEPNAGSAQRLTVFRGVASSGSAGVLTADFAGVSQTLSIMMVVKTTAIDQTTNQGVVQAVVSTSAATASPAVTFAAYGAPYNVGCLFACNNQNGQATSATAGWYGLTTQGVGWGTALDTASGSLDLVSKHVATLDTSVSMTFANSGITCAIGVELKVDSAQAGPGMVDLVRSATPALANLTGGGMRRLCGEGQGDAVYVVGGPGGYPAGDPAQITARAVAPAVGLYTGTWGKWINRDQRDDVIGNPPPSQAQHEYGYVKGLYVPVDAGTRTIAIDCKMEADPGADLRPQLVVRADTALGLNEDVVVTAASGTGWQTVSATFTVVASGAVAVWRFKRERGEYRIWWDNIVVL
jgi:hypothetical protein